MIPPTIKRKIIQVVNVFETGTVDGKYDLLSVYKDGPGGIRQITYGRSQTTEFGNLKRLLEMYIREGGIYADAFKPFLSQIGKTPSLCDHIMFRKLLVDAARNDERMRQCQDQFFDLYYYQPALVWFQGFGFTQALSLLVIYDSFIHSGSIPNFLRQKFSEKPPKFGGDENAWISQYVDVRHNWLKNHTRKVLQKTIYRTACFKQQIKASNWDLKQAVNANGTIVS
jgi:chitosanase